MPLFVFAGFPAPEHDDGPMRMTPCVITHDNKVFVERDGELRPEDYEWILSQIQEGSGQYTQGVYAYCVGYHLVRLTATEEIYATPEVIAARVTEIARAKMKEASKLVWWCDAAVGHELPNIRKILGMMERELGDHDMADYLFMFPNDG
jgi:hypothetical protein